MRKQFVKLMTQWLEEDPTSVLLLGDIGVHGFKDAAEKFKDRVHNVGVMEQATIGMASGMSLAGLRPVVHTIAPFLVERAYEQLKIDFGYQLLPGTFVSVGASFDYAPLGCTHQCPADINLIHNIPNFSALVPGHPAELEPIFKYARRATWPVYIRLSEQTNATPLFVDEFETHRPICVKKGRHNHPTVLAVGPCLDMVLEVSKSYPISVYYTVEPERSHLPMPPENMNLIVVEPYYSSRLGENTTNSDDYNPNPVNVHKFGVFSRVFMDGYGNASEAYEYSGFTAEKLSIQIEKWIY